MNIMGYLTSNILSKGILNIVDSNSKNGDIMMTNLGSMINNLISGCENRVSHQ